MSFILVRHGISLSPAWSKLFLQQREALLFMKLRMMHGEIDEAFISKQCCQKQTNDCKPKSQIKNEIKLLNTSILGFVGQLCSLFAMATSILLWLLILVLSNRRTEKHIELILLANRKDWDQILIAYIKWKRFRLNL